MVIIRINSVLHSGAVLDGEIPNTELLFAYWKYIKRRWKKIPEYPDPMVLHLI